MDKLDNPLFLPELATNYMKTTSADSFKTHKCDFSAFKLISLLHLMFSKIFRLSNLFSYTRPLWTGLESYMGPNYVQLSGFNRSGKVLGIQPESVVRKTNMENIKYGTSFNSKTRTTSKCTIPETMTTETFERFSHRPPPEC